VTKPGMTASYKYDPFGRRIEKNVNEAITKYLYDEEDIIVEYDGNNQLLTHYIHGPGIDEPIAMVRNDQSYFYHFDGLGSVTAVTDSTGTVVQRYDYDSFENIVSMLDPDFKQPYTYTSREYDEETGLYFYRARYYDAKIGRFYTLLMDILSSGIFLNAFKFKLFFLVRCAEFRFPSCGILTLLTFFGFCSTSCFVCRCHMTSLF
jgi:RHS repeat-associated protein